MHPELHRPPAPPPPAAIRELLRHEEQRHRAWLHDTVLQVLEYLATGGYGECMDPQRMMAVAARAADELRDALDSPLDETAPTAFSTAIGMVVAEARTMSDIDVHLDLGGLVDEVEPTVGNEIVAVVREALNNTRKHSGAKVARVECDAVDGQLEVRVVDDGHGFDPHTVREGLGMRCSMRERMARCGGSVAIASTPGRGVLIRITGHVDGSRITESVA